MHLTIYSDGSAKGNPGQSSIGVVIYDHHGEVVDKIAKKIGYGTNNAAEYEAMIQGLNRAKDLGAKQVSCFSDSELMVHHCLGRKSVIQPILVDKMKNMKNLIDHFDLFNIQHVKREYNKEADRLANMAYNQEIDSLG